MKSSAIKYLVLLLFLIGAASFLFYRNNKEVELVYLGKEQCSNVSKIIQLVKNYGSTQGYYPLSMANLINSLGGELRGLHEFTGEWSYLNNYTYLPLPQGYEIDIIGPRSGKTIRIKNESDFKSLCSPSNFGNL